MMEGILRGLDFLFIYLDDILVATRDAQSHMSNLRTLFQILSRHGITINRQKTRMGLAEVTYLGHRVTSRGISPLADRVDAIRDVPAPDSKVALQRYLGMVNYYRRFLPSIAKVLDPLHAAVAAARKSKKIAWTDQHQDTFVRSKEALGRAALLHHPDPAAKLPSP